MKYLIQIFSVDNSWHNTAWGGDDKDVALERVIAISKSKRGNSLTFSRVRVVEVLADIEMEWVKDDQQQ